MKDWDRYDWMMFALVLVAVGMLMFGDSTCHVQVQIEGDNTEEAVEE